MSGLPLNGCKIIGSLPRRGDMTGSSGFVVLVTRESDGEWITAVVDSLADRSWNWGNYFPASEGHAALADLLSRAAMPLSEMTVR